MAWNEPGGNGKKDPWGGNRGGNRGGNQGPPDLDELFRNFQKKFGSLFGGKGGSGSSGSSLPGGGIGLGLILALIIFLLGITGFYKIEEAEHGVVLRFGEHVLTTERGLHWRWPLIESVEKVNIAERLQVPYKATVLTKDENIIDLQGTLQYKIDSAEKYLFNVKNPKVSLNHAIESAIRLSVGRSNMDFIITEGRDEIAFRIQNTVQAIVDQYGTGITIKEVNIQDINPPQPVRQAFQDVIQAREDKQRLINEAEAYRNEVLPKARGAAARLLEEADAYEKEVVARAEGEADRFTNLLKEYNKAPQVTRDRLYIDMMESVLNNSSKVMVDIKGSNNILYLPLDKLMSRDAETGSQLLTEAQQREVLRRMAQQQKNNRSASNPRIREAR